MPDTRSRRFRIRYTFPCLLLLPNLSLHDNGFRWTDVDTCLAVDAHFLVDFCFFVLYGDCRRGAFIYAGLASGTFTGVNDCNQLIHSIVYVGEKIKNRFRYTPFKKRCTRFFISERIFYGIDTTGERLFWIHDRSNPGFAVYTGKIIREIIRR